MKTCLILEDVRETRLWLKQVLGNTFEGCHINLAANLAEARALIADVKLDLVLLDLGLPDGNGLELLDEIRETSPDAQIVVATVAGDDASIVKALSVGVQGYLLKDHEPTIISAQLRQLAMGVPALSPTIADRIMRHFQATAPLTPDVALTNREYQVLDLIGLGLRNAEVARELNIAENTTSGYIKTIYAKLGISSRAEAATYARQVRGK
ncbi:MAG: response regulator transcription factor [Sulfitobacter sp.]